MTIVSEVLVQSSEFLGMNGFLGKLIEIGIGVRESSCTRASKKPTRTAFRYGLVNSDLYSQLCGSDKSQLIPRPRNSKIKYH